jgi:UPF0755 protein
MTDKNTPNPNNAEDLLKLIEEYRSEYEHLDDDETPKSKAQEENIFLEEELIKKAESAWANHFGDVPVTTAIGESTGEVNIDAHLSDTIPEAVAEFAEETEGENKPDEVETPHSDSSVTSVSEDDDEDEKKPLPLRILFSIFNFFWNMGFMVKAVIYVVIVLIISAFLSYYVISVGNDVFAFVKPEKEITITIEEGMTRKEVAYLLEKNGIIEYSWVFNLFMIYQGDENVEFLPGERTVKSTMNYSQILQALTQEPFELIQVSITIPEGFTTDQIIDLLVANGIGERDAFVDAINNYPYKHEFVQMLDKQGYPESRRYRLEGYLYPDTYFFYKDSKEYLVINKLLNNFNDRVWVYYESTFKEDIAVHGMTFDDIITLASMVQGEAKLFIDFEPISYVFHNRLKSSDPQFKYLQSDATIQYFLPEHVEDLTETHLKTDNPYNTYLYQGLPPGAICNPGFDAISAAIYPDAPVDEDGKSINAYFFVSNKAGKTYYAVTKAQHDANKRQVAKDNAALASNDD